MINVAIFLQILVIIISSLCISYTMADIISQAKDWYAKLILGIFALVFISLLLVSMFFVG